LSAFLGNTVSKDGTMPRTGQPAIRLIGAVQRAFSVVDALAEADTELGTNEIARRTDINPSSVSRLLATLVAGGFVEHVQDSGRYRLGLRLLQLGNVVLARLDLRQVARPHLQALVESTGETATLSAPGELDAVTVAPGPLKAYTGRTITQRAALAAELEAIRARGHAYNFAEREDDLHAIAAPVWGSRGELIAIIGVQGPASRFAADAMEAAVGPLREHTAELSVELGWNGLVEEAKQT
jgi:DNA-binding IclR family transcriptional regulator